jgi:hypothetical protein
VKILVVAMLAFASATAIADEEEAVPPPPAKGTSLVSTKAAWRWQVVTAPKIPRAVGALAVSGVDVASGRATQVAPVLGEIAPRPASWPYDVTDAKPAIGKPGEGDRIAAAFGVTTFQITDAQIAMLELRLRYRDGVVVWLNGVEVVRQALPRGTPNTLALRQHGPEWETFYIPAAPGLLVKGTNTLAIEAHPSGRRAWPEIAADLIGRSDRGIVRGPNLAETTQAGATIVVETDPDVDAQLEWGLGSATDRVQKSPPGRRHVFALTGLAPGARYSYRVRAGSSQSARYGFHTLPKHGALLRIGIYGDVRGGHAMHRRLVERMLDEGLDLVAVSGDMVAHGSDEADWQRFFAITQELRAQLPYYPAVGNHDLGWDGPDGSSSSGRASLVFALPLDPSRPKETYWYSRDVADVHLVFLDSNAYDRVEQETWLEQDLAAARKRGVRAIIAVTHDGPYARGYHGGNAIGRARYVPILARHKVELLISGHDHIYQRGDQAGVRYVVSGGGGAPLYGIRCGVDGRPKCAIDDGMQAVHREHHYGVITIGRDLEWCPRRPDGTLLEKCTRIPFGRP